MITSYEEYIEMRDKVGVTDHSVTKALNLGNAFFYKWRKRDVKNPRVDTLKRITEHLKNTPRG